MSSAKDKKEQREAADNALKKKGVLDVSREGRTERALSLQARMNAVSGESLGKGRWKSAKQLWRDMRTHLIKASHEKLIKTDEASIIASFKCDPKRRSDLPGSTHSMAYGEDVNWDRVQDHSQFPHVVRADQAWFDFQLSVKEKGNEIEILAYDAEIRFPNQNPCGFVRLDLNHPSHDNKDEGGRAHMHVNSGDDGFVVPSPIFDPHELLDILLHGLKTVGRQRRKKPVSPVSPQNVQSSTEPESTTTSSAESLQDGSPVGELEPNNDR